MKGEYCMSILSTIFLGLIQGIAEFLPISSSGHLSIFQHFLNMDTGEGDLLLEVLLHLGTLFAVCIVYRKDIVEIVVDFFAMIRNYGHPLPGRQRKYPGVRVLLMMFFATLPLFVIVPFNDQINKLYSNTYFIGFALILTGIVLFISDKMVPGRKNGKTMTIVDALIIGVCQAIATIPGLSRSGTTITAGIVAGLDRKFAVKFSFLISIPAVLGANILTIADVIKEGGVDPSAIPAYLVGMLFAMVSGYLSIKFVQMLTNSGKFGKFAYYCWGVGALTILLSIIL